MAEALVLFGTPSRHRALERLQPRRLFAQVSQEQVGHIGGQPGSHHDPQDGEVLTILREGVRRHQPAELTQPGRHVEHGVVGHLWRGGEGQHRQLASVGDEPVAADRRNLAGDVLRDPVGRALYL